jgi:hypothetical protein
MMFSTPPLVTAMGSKVVLVTEAPASFMKVPPPFTLMAVTVPEMTPKFVILIGVKPV